MRFNTPLEVRGTSDDFIPFYKSLDPNSKLYKSITDTINLIKQGPTRGDHVEYIKSQNIILKNSRLRHSFESN